jgi:hypothetical protein
MSLHEYQSSLELFHKDTPFYVLIMAAMLKADSKNEMKLRAMWPHVWEELQKRYHAPGGLLPED